MCSLNNFYRCIMHVYRNFELHIEGIIKLNSPDYYQYIGFLGAFCTTISFLPQAIKIHQTKNTTDISLPMWILLSIGICCWLAYGFLLRDLPLMTANVITLTISVFILFSKLKYG